MKTVAAIAVAFGVATAPAYAGPTKMTDEQLDNVTAAGHSLIDADVTVKDVEVVAQVGVAVAALGSAAGNVLKRQ